ncbi:MAG: T9SS type A sorting domain-containing protein [Bacteroidia bacterium]|nr:T9SS type A sorting domain-containing protein [Bacteroidia bacterium]
MSKMRIQLATGLLSLLCLLSAVPAQATIYTWTGAGANSNWNTPANWSPNGVPGSSDDAFFSSNASVNVTAAVTVLSFSITGATVTLLSDTSVTVTSTMTLTDALLQLGYITPTRAGFPLVIAQNAALSLLGVSGSRIVPNGSPSKHVNIRLFGSVNMGDLRVCHIGALDASPNILSRLERSSGQFTSDVRFEGNVVLNARVNLGAYNVWLGKNAGNSRITTTGANQDCFTFTDVHTSGSPIGRIIKSAKYWQDGNGNWDPNVSYFIIETGFDVSQGNMSMGVDINVAQLDNSWSATSTEPFRGVSVRYVRQIHPENQATGNKVVAKYWVVQPVGFLQESNPFFAPFPPANSICYAVEFNTSDVSAPAEAYAAIWSDNYEDNNGGAWYSYGSQFGGQNIGGRLYVVMCPTYYFGDITIGEGSNQIPVELTSFAARYVRNNVELNWQTATELNNYGFAIERSLDGRVWEEIDFVQGAGNSYSPRNYSYTDLLDDRLRRVPQIGYRLRQIDRDGTTDYSDIVFVKTGVMPSGVELYDAYPNPFNPSTTISFSLRETQPVTMKVFNIFGQEVVTLMENAQTEAGFHTVAFRGDNLPSGSYLVVMNAGGALKQQRLVLNK